MYHMKKGPVLLITDSSYMQANFQQQNLDKVSYAVIQRIITQHIRGNKRTIAICNNIVDLREVRQKRVLFDYS